MLLSHMPSFDIVSKINYQEIDNAVANCLREITQRYDFKGSSTSIKHEEKTLVIITEDETKLRQVIDLITTHFVRRKIDPKCLKEKNKEVASGNSIRLIYDLVEGISQDISKKIIANIKSSKIKVQTKIQGDELRVNGKKKDDLQDVISLVKEIVIDQPLQFINFRD